MEVRIIEEGESYEEKIHIILNDDDLDNTNYVDLIITSEKKKDGESEGEVFLANVTVSVEDLFRAVELFNKQRLEHKFEREN